MKSIGNQIKKVKLRTSSLSDGELDDMFDAKYLDEIMPTLSTGDILLFRGCGEISKVIKKLTLCCFSHVGMVIRNPSPAIRKAYCIPDDEKEQVFVYESNATTQPPRPGGGTHLVTLKWKLERAVRKEDPNYLLCVRRLTVNDTNAEELFPELENFLLEMQGVSYEMQKLDLLASTTYVGTIAVQSDLNSVFCAELATAAYKKMGLLGESVNPTNSLPRTFSSSQRLIGQLKLKRGAKLGKEIRIKCRKSQDELQKEYLAANPEKLQREIMVLKEKLCVTLESGNFKIPPNDMPEDTKSKSKGTFTAIGENSTSFVKITYRDQKSGSAKKKTLSPQWNEIFSFVLTSDWNDPSEDPHVTFCVFKSRIPSSDFIGMAYINLATTPLPYYGELKLNTVGSIKVRVSIEDE